MSAPITKEQLVEVSIQPVGPTVEPKIPKDVVQVGVKTVMPEATLRQLPPDVVSKGEVLAHPTEPGTLAAVPPITRKVNLSWHHRLNPFVTPRGDEYRAVWEDLQEKRSRKVAA